MTRNSDRSSIKRRTFLATGAATASTLMLPQSARANRPVSVPPEDAPHQATLMMWPASNKVYPNPAFRSLLQHTIARIANTIAAFEPVILLAHPDDHPRAKQLLSGRVTLWDIPTEDLWARDAGPVFAKTPGGPLRHSHIEFNGWGNKQVHRRDARVALAITNRLGLETIETGLKGEAGGVEHDGHGLLMAHESSWVINNRNPGLSRDEIEARLLTAYGAKRMIWAKGLKRYDITDYHIDSLARFTGPGRVLINLPQKPDPSDPFHMAALNTHATLLAQGLEVDVIPEPAIRRVSSPDFVASYVNYYVCNGAVIAPTFGDPKTDPQAVQALRRHYPNREIIALNTDPLGEVGGGIHCATHELPAT